MTRSVSKASRLLLLYLLRESGVLDDDVRRADVARWLSVDRSTITKDMKAMQATLDLYHGLEATQPWIRRYYSTAELAEALGLDERTALAMLTGGVIRGEREHERANWRVPVAEVERWRALLKK